MEEILKKSDLDINSWLIDWGLIRGEYNDGVIETTKSGLRNNWFTFWLFLISSIKWTTLMFYSKESQVAIYLGEWAPWFGPKLVVDSMLLIQSFNSLILVILFYFCSRNPEKFLLWVEFMKFNTENRSFDNLNLNKLDSKRFAKQFALSWFIVKRINYLLISLSFSILFVSFFYLENKHHLYYLISFVMFTLCLKFYTNHWFSLLLVLYQV